MKRFLALLLLSVLNISLAHSAVVIDIVETGGDVQATLSGDINLGALGSFGGTSGHYDGVIPTLGVVAFNSDVDYYNINIDWTKPFGTGAGLTWDSSTGDNFSMFTDPALGLPAGYISQSALTAIGTKTGSSFLVLGMIPGIYVTTLTNGEITDTVTVNIGQAVPPVPPVPPVAPATPVPTISAWGLGILATLMGMIGFIRRRNML